jgi:hypothetical protein
MVAQQLRVTIDPQLLDAIQERTDPDEVEQFVNDAVRYYLQVLNLRDVEAELTAKHGPISEEAKRRVAEMEWIV